ncbi:MAG: hypothetical protein [Microvirus sp.]|nr:MAG: hypothetical protein [Microvirus sp.]
MRGRGRFGGRRGRSFSRRRRSGGMRVGRAGKVGYRL